MEEAKAAAYYDELTRKGEGAARFKQGLGFSSSASSDAFPPKPSSSSSTFLSNFVRASSPGKAEKQAQLETIQAKLRRSRRSASPECCRSRERDDRGRRRSSSRERRRERNRSRRLPSREERRRSRSYSDEEEGREGYRRSQNGKRDSLGRRRSRSSSPSRVSRGGDRDRNRRREERRTESRSYKEKSDKVDYARLIEGYSQMTQAERVKAKMKLQLSQTASKDSTMGMSTGWERFDFNKDAPLDDDEIEVAEDEGSLVKEIGKSFRFTAVQAKREDEIKAAHDEAMFGGSSAAASTFPEVEATKVTDTRETTNEKENNNLLLSDKVLAMQQGSWRDRARRLKSGSDA
ncbi:hypothetical protein AXF42_Ash007474 [Apostasia shenzhenica]|uniref:Uncharacterized protein n=1 Tax=Apostasia shenzhenica TaxID=1088818 RepID=A0A2I0A5J8_9ASPA|nr:hypothetical protein AXF42_Ash007474 [Apostasia shenzhenica]